MRDKYDWGDLQELSEMPSFTSDESQNPIGIDPLGTRVVNLRLIDFLLPGVTNSTKHLRYYSVATWAAWKFFTLYKERGLKDVSKKEFKSFFERVESVFMVGNVLTEEKQDGEFTIIGRRSFPEGVELYPTSFKGYKRKVSILDAVNYGPSLKIGPGLRFLREDPQGILVTTPERGEPLAKFMDKLLRQSDFYDFFENLEEKDFTADLATDISRKAFSIKGIPKRETLERKILTDALFDFSAGDEPTQVSRRQTSLALFLEIIENLAPIHLDDIYSFLTYGYTGQGKTFEMTTVLLNTSFVFQIFMLRQYQRYALEAILSSFEALLINKQVSTNQEFTDSVFTGSKRVIDDFRLDYENVVETVLEEFVRDIAEKVHLKDLNIFDTNTFSKDAWNESNRKLAKGTGLSEYILTDYIDELIENGEYEAVTFASVILLIITVLRSLSWLAINANEDLSKFFYLGGCLSVSLSTTADDLKAQLKGPLVKYVEFIVKEYIVSQHMYVTTKRFDGRNRLHFGIEEGRLTPYWYKLYKPSWTSDRIGSTLSLLTDTGLIASRGDEEDEYYIPRNQQNRVSRILQMVFANTCSEAL